MLVVQKFGGSSLATPEQIHSAAFQIAALHKKGHPLIVVVSAMGKTTDDLVKLAYSVSSTPNRRELDMLLSTGERMSMALVSMSLNDLACKAISFTGSQAGVFTDELHSNARIIDIKPLRVEAELTRGNVVILAGFQGVSPLTKEITTLGRGGSDTTAVAMAAYFRASRCEIRKDVDGVHSGDPNLIAGTSHIPHLHYKTLLDLTYWGAKVLHYRSVELSLILNVPLTIGLAHGEGRSTLVDGETEMFENAAILSVNTHQDVRWLNVKKSDLTAAFQDLNRALKSADLPLPHFLDSELQTDSCRFLITGPTETLDAVSRLTKLEPALTFDSSKLSTVTATCQGAFASPLPYEIATALKSKSIQLHKMLFGAMSVTVVIDSRNRDTALQTIHDLKAK